jgi:hypothetical protein
MDREEYEKIKQQGRESGEIYLSKRKWIEYLLQDKLGREEFSEFLSEVSRKLHEISEKLDRLHNYTHGHIEGHPIFRDIKTSENEIVTRHEWEGQPIVFKKIGEM